MSSVTLSYVYFQLNPFYRDELESDCSKHFSNSATHLNPYFLMFLLGQTLHGIGATPLFSIGTAYLDENVSQKASPVYLGKEQ